MKPEKQNLIRDLLDEDSNRETTLRAGACILRRRRHWRVARQSAAILALVAIAAFLAVQRKNPTSLRVASVAPKAPPVSKVQALTDDELLALFPNTPVALASLPDGKKQLIFPRPGDEERFITRL